MARAFIAIGSNIDPAANVRLAIGRLGQKVRLVGVSTVYRTEALSRPGAQAGPLQPPYYNCVVEIETFVPPLELKQGILRPIEDSLGRLRSEDKFAPRTIDLDLIVYGDLEMDEGGLKLPDPEIMERPFLAIPLYELAPGLELGSNRSIASIASGLPQGGMQPLKEYTRQLQQDLEQVVLEFRE
jgi:dihydroneopterin aldolase/2-amino-4-hydroxy-6-hydroxymethyldihydropteridine diphosphokinase